MNRLLKPLAVALALVMVMVILPVSVKADTSLSISNVTALVDQGNICLLYTSPSPRDW